MRETAAETEGQDKGTHAYCRCHSFSGGSTDKSAGILKMERGVEEQAKQPIR